MKVKSIAKAKDGEKPRVRFCKDCAKDLRQTT